MTQDELVGVLQMLGTDEARWLDSVRTVAELCLLEFLAAEGYSAVVEAYLALRQTWGDAEVRP